MQSDLDPAQDFERQEAAELYEEVARVYTRLLSLESPEAAAAIRKIHFTVGAHAAMRTALIMQVLKVEIRHNHTLPNLNNYAYLLRDYPEATAGFEQALAHCLLAWGLDDVERSLHIGILSQIFDSSVGTARL